MKKFLLILLICILAQINHRESRLTDSQIASLRETYPIYGVKIPPLIEMHTPAFTEVKNSVETFVYGEVVGEAQTYHKLYDFYEYPLSIIKDTKGKYQTGDHITITANKIFEDYNPKLSAGMKVVVPVTADTEVAGRTHYTVIGMYYVTEDGYVLSAYEESDVNYSGLKIEELLKRLKK